VAARASREERLRAIGEAWPIAAIFVVMLIGIYAGFFTPTEGAAVATVATLLLGIFRRALTWTEIKNCFLPTAQATAMIFIVLLGATMMNTALAVSQVPADLARWMTGLEVHPLIIIGCFLLAFVLLTCVLDELAMMLLFLPILLPIIAGLDLFGLSQEYKFIWFGILMLHVVAMGLVAPPIGLNVYVVANIAKNVPIGEIYRGVLPYLVWDFLRVLLLLFFPIITLWAVRFAA
jgi:C4-dicarboxylate transporter DctM subunit